MKLSATANASNGGITNVAFFREATNLSDDATVPHSFTWACGDPDNFDSNYQINAEGVLVLTGAPTTTARWVKGYGIVTVNDGPLTVNDGAGAANNKIAFLPPINLVSPTRTNGAFQFALQGLNYVIETSTNLTSWAPVVTNTPVSNLLQFVEPTLNLPAKYYRGRLP